MDGGGQRDEMRWGIWSWQCRKQMECNERGPQRYWPTTPRVRHSRGPPFPPLPGSGTPGPLARVRVRVRRTPGMGGPGGGRSI